LNFKIFLALNPNIEATFTLDKIDGFRVLETLQRNNEVLADMDCEQAEASGNKPLAELHDDKYWDEVVKTNLVADAVNAADEAGYQQMKIKRIL